MKDIDFYTSIFSVNPLYLIINETIGYIEEDNGNKYLIFAPIDENKEVLRKYTELWNKIKNLIETINDKLGEYEKGFMKIKFDSDDDLPLSKILKFHNLTIVVRSIFQEYNKYYPQIYLDEYFYEL